MSTKTEDTPSVFDFVDHFKVNLASFSIEDQVEVCKNLQPFIGYLLDHNHIPYEKQTKQVQLQLRTLIKDNPLFSSPEVRNYFEKIIANTRVLTFDSQRLDFYIKTRVLINFNNLFVAVRSYDGCCEGGGHCDIHLKEGPNSCNNNAVQLFKRNNFENCLHDVNDTELLEFYDRLIICNNSNSPAGSTASGGSFSDCIVTYDQFKVFVVELFLSDFDY